MKLTELEPQFIRYKGDKHAGHSHVASLAEAQGIRFLCPTCKVDYGDDCHSIVLPFRGRNVDASINGGHQWDVSGTDSSNLTLKPSVNAAGGGCRWHGWVTNGEVT